MGMAIARVLAPFLALAVFMVLVGALAESELLAGEPRPAETGIATPSTRTTVLELFGPGAADPTGAEGAGLGTDPDGSDAGAVDGDGSTGESRTYTVKAGDNPYEIARQFDVTAAELMELNGIDDPTELQVGSVLRIPQP